MAKKSFIYNVLKATAFLALLMLTACGGATENNHQFTIGLATNNPNGLRNIQGFTAGMTDLGYIENDTVTYIFEGKPTSGKDLDLALQKMVDANVNLIFTAGTPTGVAAQRITTGTDIPVVFGVIADPIAAGVMEDLTRPGGNMTGVKPVKIKGGV